MKKRNAKLICIGLIAFTVIAWVGLVKRQLDSAVEYKQYIKKAESFEEKEIYIDALENYELALEIKPDNQKLTLKIADIHYKLAQYNDFIEICDSLISSYPDEPEAYIKKANYYMEKENYPETLDVLEAAKESISNNEELKKIEKTLSTKCIEKYVGYESIKDWHIQEDYNYVAAQEYGRWGMIKKDGSKKILMKYDYLGAYDSETGVIPCALDGEYYYINREGYRKLVGDNTYEFLGSFGCGLAPAKRDGVYGYINVDFKEQNFEFDYAGTFSNNVAAVKKGDKWALINEKLREITKFEYDEILLDSNGFCSVYDVIVARKGNTYVFLNHKGKTIGAETFESAKLPASNDEYIAVKQNGMWGFADKKGKVVIKPQYEDAKSFSMNLAPICVKDRWGYIDSECNIIVEPEYFDAGVFSADGAAPIKKVSTWNILVLCEYDN